VRSEFRWQPAQVIQNHENEHVRSIGQGEARQRKYSIRGLNLAAVKLKTVQVTKPPLQHRIKQICMLSSEKPGLTEDLYKVQKEEFQ
jgi:hypothetical protein